MSKKNRNKQSAQKAAEQKLEQAVVAVEEVPAATEPEPPAEQAAVAEPAVVTEVKTTAESILAGAEAEVERLLAQLKGARQVVRELKNGPVAPATDANGNPLTAGQRAWLTRVARLKAQGIEFVPKGRKAAKVYDANDPNLTAGQKAYVTRLKRLADPNYKPAKKAADKPSPQERLDAAVKAAFERLLAGHPEAAATAFAGGTRVDLSGPAQAA
jgi:hypothetical protein